MDMTRARGDTYGDEFIIKSKNTKLPIDITDYLFYLTLNKIINPSSTTDQLYSLVGTTISALDGRVEFAPNSVQADQVGVFYYDIQMIDGNGRKRTIQKGKYIYTQDITK